MSKGTRFDKEFKEQAVRLVYDTNKSVPQIAKDLGINANTLYGWKMKQAYVPGSTGLTPVEEENRRLKKELAEAIMERDILKKAVAIFSTPWK